MDISINLLPKEINIRLQRKRKQRLHLIAGGVIIMALAGAYGFLAVNTLQVQTEIARLQKERLALENQIESYAPYSKLQAQVANAGQILRSAVGAPPDLQQLLAGIGLYIPPNVWLTDFATTLTNANQTADEPAPEESEQLENKLIKSKQKNIIIPAGEVILHGWTFDHLSVANWLETIRQVPGLTDIRCQYSTEEELDGQTLVKFEIKASILPGPDYQPPTKKAGA